ncbi:hypothetical protein EAF04_010798 [Stromatinia cepivora]|nr:hypothetical protein EAF04_010798 [Stromatinia cepivora]
MQMNLADIILFGGKILNRYALYVLVQKHGDECYEEKSVDEMELGFGNLMHLSTGLGAVVNGVRRD